MSEPVAPLADIPFSSEEEASIMSLGRLMLIAGVLQIVGAAAAVIAQLMGVGAHVSALGTPGSSVGGIVSGLVTVVVSLLLGTALIFSSGAFRRVATTSGSDQVLLGEGFRKLRLYFMVKGAILLLAIPFACLAGLLVSVFTGP